MPKINVYLPDDLAEAVRVSGVPVSAVCQRALTEAVRRVTAIRSAVIGELTDEGLAARLPHFTARSRAVLMGAGRQARAESAGTIHTGHLLQAILDDGESLAVQVLNAMDADFDQLSTDLAGEAVTEPGAAPDGLHFSSPAANALELAVTEATAFNHNYIGTEHILLGLVTETEGRAGEVLRSHGATAKPTRRALSAMLTIYAQARAHGASTGTPASSSASSAATPAATTGAAGGRAVMAEALQQAMAPVIARIERLEERLA
jgi:ATP-dependent Clp protease ATP-binding subunit ClpC